MKLTQKLAYSQLKANRRRTIWTLLGIALSTAMITAVYGFAMSGYEAVMRVMGETHALRREYMLTFYLLSVILSAIIVAASIIVVSNSFRVSAGERLKQFGMLKSTGATKQQIAATIMYESVFLSAIGIPAGIMLGLLVQFTGLEIVNRLLIEVGSGIQELSGGEVETQAISLPFVVAWQAMLGSGGVSFATVLLSAWLPARKAAKVPAIDAIRGAGEVKISRRQVKANRLVQRLFGFEGTLASKSLKRSKRNFRATVVSLTISIILFISASSFGDQLNRMANLAIQATDANVIAQYQSWSVSTFRDDGYSYRIYETISSDTAEAITARLREFPDTTVFGVGNNGSTWAFAVPVPQEMLTRKYYEWFSQLYNPDGLELENFNMVVNLITVDAENYAELCRLAGVPLGSNILVNYSRQFVDGRWTEFTPYVFSGQTLTFPSLLDGGIIDTGVLQELTLHGVLEGSRIPKNVLHISRGSLNIIVPRLDSGAYHWLAESADPRGFTEYARAVLDEFIPLDEESQIHTGVRNITAEQNADRNVVRIVMVFTFGFVGMLTLIGLTNVISTISTNIRSRSREFAVLQSAGMAQTGLNRMLNLESILCSAKSLIIGLPLGAGASYLIYLAVMQAVDFDYRFPWLAALQSVLAVFVITWVTMRYAAANLRNKNIVETIRSESAM